MIAPMSDAAISGGTDPIALEQELAGLLLDPADYAPWLGEEPESGLGVGFLLKPFPAEAMVAYPLGRRVGNPANHDPECIAAVSGRRRRPHRATQLPVDQSPRAGSRDRPGIRALTS